MTEQQDKDKVDLNDPDNPIRWKHRRRMAYIAIINMSLGGFLIMFGVPIDRLDKIEEPMGWFFIAMSTITCAYMGLTTFSHLGKK